MTYLKRSFEQEELVKFQSKEFPYAIKTLVFKEGVSK